MTSVYALFLQHLRATRPAACWHVEQEYPKFLATYHNQDTLPTMNAFWRYKLANLPINTIDVRAYLRDDDILTTEEWLVMFDATVLPYVYSIYGITEIIFHSR